MSWRLWQRMCGYAALAAAVMWAAKFTIISLGTGAGTPRALVPAATLFVGFLVPTLGSVLGLIVPFALAAPFLSGRRLRVALPIAAATGVVAIVLTALVTGAAGSLLSGAASEVLRAEGVVLVGAAASLASAAWLLRPRIDGRLFAFALAAGGALWLAKGAAVAAGASQGGLVMVSYQLGLWLLAAAAVVLIVDAAIRRRFVPLAVALGAYVLAGALGAVPVLGGELGLLALGAAAVAAAVALRARASEPGTVPPSLRR